MIRIAIIITMAIGIFTGFAPVQNPYLLAYAATTDNPWGSVNDRSLVTAIEAFEKFSGGKLLEIRFRNKNGVVGYDAVVTKGDVISNLSLSVPDENVVAIAEVDVPQWMADWKLRRYKESVEKAKIPLSEAVLKAEQIGGGPAVDAGLAKPLSGDNAVLAYNVELIKDGKPKRVAIDAVTGLPIANPESLLDPWTPEKALYESLHKVVRD